jgi:Uma2 family endonuclease
LSPNDESRDKLPFYAACSVDEVWLLEPKTRAFEIFWLSDRYAQAHDRSPTLDIAFSTDPGPLLRLAWPGGGAEL